MIILVTNRGEEMILVKSENLNFLKNPDDWDDMVSEYKRATSNGVTFTQRGLQEAKDIYRCVAPSSDRHKLLFVLTDGAPNRSWTTSDRGITNLEMFPDLKYFTNFNKGSKLKL